MQLYVENQVGPRLTRVREHLRLKQGEFAEMAGISRSYVSEVESGKQTPSFNFCLAVATRFDVSLDWLFFEKGTMFILPDDHFLNHLTEDEIRLLQALSQFPPDLRNETMLVLSNFLLFVVRRIEQHGSAAS
jgi:transcriptional regulator with XRE-family HTH domain